MVKCAEPFPPLTPTPLKRSIIGGKSANDILMINSADFRLHFIPLQPHTLESVVDSIVSFSLITIFKCIQPEFPHNLLVHDRWAKKGESRARSPPTVHHSYLSSPQTFTMPRTAETASFKVGHAITIMKYARFFDNNNLVQSYYD